MRRLAKAGGFDELLHAWLHLAARQNPGSGPSIAKFLDCQGLCSHEGPRQGLEKSSTASSH